jgi:Ala-tRNA(Pro) deacylase
MSATHQQLAPAARGIDAALRDAGVAHRLVAHPDCASATEQARVTRVPAGMVAKTLVTTDRGRVRLAVVPASRRLDLQRMRHALGTGRHLRLATEDEIAAAFPHFERGATPPLGRMLGVEMVLDPLVLGHDRVLAACGDRRHGVLVDPVDLMRVADARVVDITTHRDHRFSEHPLGNGRPRLGDGR